MDDAEKASYNAFLKPFNINFGDEEKDLIKLNVFYIKDLADGSDIDAELLYHIEKNGWAEETRGLKELSITQIPSDFINSFLETLKLENIKKRFKSNKTFRYDNLKTRIVNQATYIDVNKRYLGQEYVERKIDSFELGMDMEDYKSFIDFRFIANFIRSTNTIFFYAGLTLMMQLLYELNIKETEKLFLFNLCNTLLRPEYLKYCNIDLLFELDEKIQDILQINYL